RRTLLDNAAHLAQPLQFVMPVYGSRGRWFDKWFYGAGLVIYDLLAGRAGLGRTRFLDRKGTIAAIPGVRTESLAGAVAYWDGIDRKSTRLNSSHVKNSYAVFCLEK